MEESLFLSIKSTVDIFILVAIALYVTWHLWNKRSPQSPPGPRGIPLLGAITEIRKHPEHAMMKWNQQYGPVCMVRLGLKDVLVLGSYEAAHEALVKNIHIADRPTHNIEVFYGGKGILMINSGSFHQEQRRFGLNTLREYGMGRRALEPTILIYVNDLCDRIEKYGSDPFVIDGEVYLTISSTISHIVFGHDVIHDNPKFKEIIFKMIEPNKLNVLAGILAFAPFLKHFPFFSTVHKSSKEFRLKLQSLIGEEVQEHKRTRDPTQSRDFIDSFLQAMEKTERSGDKSKLDQGGFADVEDGKLDPSWEPYSSFTIDQLTAMVRDLFMAATDTTSSTICWIILFLCKNTDVQIKMQEEIDEVLGQNGILKYELATKMHYVRAVIQEIARLRPSVPLSLPHASNRDTSIMGYKVPKDTIVLTNIWGIHHDEKIWKNPYEFNPERHLDANGNFVKSKKVMQFNIGLRSCLGQQLANMELFLVTVSLFHRFSFSVVNPKIDMGGESMVSLRPYPYSVVATTRG